MIQRFYVHNFRCLENFELLLADKPSVLLIGKNGAGKTTVALALEILQRIGRGTNRVGDLIKVKDFTRGRTETPIRFELEVELDARRYRYDITFELPTGFKELRVREERLVVNDSPIYTRECAQVTLVNTKQDKGAHFSMDWHLVALPIIQASAQDPLHLFKLESSTETLEPNVQVTNFGAWFSGLLAETPSAYSKVETYLKEVMPDLKDIKNPVIATDFRTLLVRCPGHNVIDSGPSDNHETESDSVGDHGRTAD